MNHTEGMTEIEISWHFENMLAALSAIYMEARPHADHQGGNIIHYEVAPALVTAARAAVIGVKGTR